MLRSKSIRPSPSSGKCQTRALFRLGGVWYSLPLTDPAMLKSLASHPHGCFPENGENILLTISLDEPFARDGYCYKLIAALIQGFQISENFFD